jgi:hypothetical protein
MISFPSGYDVECLPICSLQNPAGNADSPGVVAAGNVLPSKLFLFFLGKDTDLY